MKWKLRIIFKNKIYFIVYFYTFLLVVKGFETCLISYFKINSWMFYLNSLLKNNDQMFVKKSKRFG